MIILRRILVATDFSEAASSALDYGRDLARQYGAELHLLHVEDDVTVRYAFDMAPVYLPEVQQDIENSARERTSALLTDEDRQALKARAVVRVSMSTAAAIVDYAQAEQIDLIIVGTHGRGAVAHLLVGSVAERVVRTASCPVLTVRRHEREFLVPDALVTSRAHLAG